MQECSSAKKTRPSSSSDSGKVKCFVCDSSEGTLHRVMTFQLNKRVRKCATILEDVDLLAKLNSGYMIACDSVYHSPCLLDLYRKSYRKENEAVFDDTDKRFYGQVLVELVQYMEQVAKNENTYTFKLVDLAKLFKERVKEIGGHTPDRLHATKLKNRLLAHVETLREFSDNRFSYLTFNETLGDVIKSYHEQSREKEAFVLSEGAKILRRYIFDKNFDGFDGSLSKKSQDSFIPLSLKSFIDTVLQGNKINSCIKGLEQASQTISQLLIQNSMKRVRHNQNRANKIRRNKFRESPLVIYLGLLIHTKTRRRKLIEKFHDLGISISYQRVMDLSVEMGNKVLNHYEEQNLVCPPLLKLNLFTASALDNIDHNPSFTTSGDSFHGTEISLFRHKDHKDDGLDQTIQNQHK